MSQGRRFVSACYATLVLAIAARATEAPPFEFHDVPCGAHPFWLAVADFNADGSPDLYGTTGMQGVFVLEGAGSGSFRPARFFPVGAHPRAAAADDFDEDGHLDIAVACAGADRVELLLGDGTGGFALPPVKIAVPVSPSGLAAGDLDGDGHVDIVTTTSTSDVSLRRGNGDASFGPPERIGGYLGLVSVYLSDLDQDGDLDVVAGNDGTGHYFMVQKNFGAASFRFANGYGGSTLGQAPRTAAIGDVDDDGKVDIVTAVFGADVVYVLRGDGTARFQVGSSATSGDHPSSVALADLDLDGREDVITTDYSGRALSILMGSDTGVFSQPVRLTTPDYPIVVVCADLDVDGRPDLACTSFIGGDVRVFLNASSTPAGIESFGRSTFGCRGAHGATATAPGSLSSSSFAVAFTNAPPNARGFAIASPIAVPGGSHPFPGSPLYNVDPAAPGAVSFGLRSDSSGVARQRFSLAATGAQAGSRVNVQSYWRGGACGPGSAPSSSLGVAIAVGP